MVGRKDINLADNIIILVVTNNIKINRKIQQ